MPRVHFANSSPTRVPAAVSTQMHDIPDLTPQDKDMLRVTPPDYLKFTRGDAKDGTLELTCISSSPVTYKIQTTSPEKFRVRPRCGILNPGETVAVSILLKPEHLLSDNGKDKFLIMCMPSMDIQSSQVAEFWKKVGQQSVNMEQHRLYCTYKDVGTNAHQAVGNGGVNSGSSGDKNEDHMSTATAETRKLEKQLRYTQILQIVTLVFLLILSAAVIYLLKLQMCGDEGCLSSKEGTADSVDFANCAKGKADL